MQEQLSRAALKAIHREPVRSGGNSADVRIFAGEEDDIAAQGACEPKAAFVHDAVK